MYKAWIFGLLMVMLSACSTKEKVEELKPLNLLEYGIPVTIMAPDSAKVKRSTIGQFQDITVKKGDYGVQILVVDAVSTNLAEVKAEALKNAREEGFFSKVIREEDNGFVFLSKIDSLEIYDFRYVMVKGDKEYTFRADLMSQLDLNGAERLFSAVKQQ